MNSKSISARLRLAHAVAGIAVITLTSAALADQRQNAAVQADQATLNAAGFGKIGNIVGPLNGDVVSVGVIEAGGGLANVAGPNANTAPNSSLKNGNPDLKSANVKQFQFAGNVIPANGSTIAGLAVGNHASAVTGVVVGAGTTAAADQGISFGSTVYQAGIIGADFAPGGSPDLIQQSIQKGSSTVNMSFGSLQGGVTYRNGAGAAAFTGFTQATDGLGNPLFLKANGTATSTPGAGDPTYSTAAGNFFVPIYALGANGLPAVNNNGQSFQSEYVDWQATATNTLMIVAGNEGPNFTRIAGSNTQAYYAPAANGGAPNLGLQYGSPSDAHNILNVAATGVRTDASKPLNYDQASPYNTPNTTSDGRIGVDIVAPGGDPFSSFSDNFTNYKAYLGVAGNTAANNTKIPANGFPSQFQSTAGGVGGASSDTYNGNGPGGTFSDVTTGSAFTTVGANSILPGPAGTIAPRTPHGTSYAAPLVSGASALVDQYGLLASGQNIKSSIGNFNFSRNATDPLDHRVIKAILMNGAVKINPDGKPLLRTTGTPWTASAPQQGAKGLPANLAANAVGPVTTMAQSGLDPQLGAGQLNVLDSLQNYAAGEQGPGAPGAANVLPIGWDYETVAAAAPANTTYTYNFHYNGNMAGFQATLAWDFPVSIAANAGPNDANGNPTFQTGANAGAATSFAQGALTDLDLYFFQVNPNGTLLELGASNSNIDNVEHIYDQPLDGAGNPLALPAGNYQIDVVAPNGVAGAATVPFGLAWAFVPEPTCLAMLVIPMALTLRRRR
jgi:hypothetical protein